MWSERKHIIFIVVNNCFSTQKYVDYLGVSHIIINTDIHRLINICFKYGKPPNMYYFRRFLVLILCGKPE
jgi:hypothetical protein